MMYNTSNPAELYSGTIGRLLATDKYLKTTTGTPLSSGGSNSFTIQKANLPAVKVQLDSFQLGRGTQEITGNLTQETIFQIPQVLLQNGQTVLMKCLIIVLENG